MESGNEVTNDTTKINASYDASSGELSFKLLGSNSITIKVYKKTSSEKEQEIGILKLYSGTMSWDSGIRIDSENKSGYKLMGDINNDGYVTTYDQLAILRLSVKYDDGWDEEAKERADMDGDGKITSKDSLIVGRMNAQVTSELFNVIKKNEEITFFFAKSDEQNLSEDWTNDVEWEIIYLDGSKDDFEIINQTKASYKIKAIGDNGTRAIIKAREILEDGTTECESFIYIEINDLAINLSTNEIKYDLADENQEHIIITPSINIRKNPIEIKSNNEKIAKIKNDKYGNVEVIPGGETGTTMISFTCKEDGVTEECTVTVEKGVTKIEVENDIEEITVKEGSTYKKTVTINEDATEEIDVTSSDTKVATIYLDKESGRYTIKAISPGEAQVAIYSPSNTEINKIIKVKVEEVKAPTINNIKYSKGANEGKFKAGDKINLEIDFDREFAGDQAPELKISFNNSTSKNNTIFESFSNDNTSLIYSYTFAEGDNGTLRIDNLTGGNLTDVTGKYEIVKTMDNNYYKSDSTESDGESENTQKGEYINDGIYKEVEGVKVDTIAPVLKIETGTTKHWLTTGDNIEVKIISTNDVLAKAPKVYFNDVEAKVEGENTIFTATLKVTDKIKEGYLEITVDDYEDTFGNKGEKLDAKYNNIDQPIIIDKSAPSVEVGIAKTESQDGNYKAGDKVKITLYFVNSGEDTVEYIKADEAPKLNLTFGDKKAQGKLTNNFEPSEDGKNWQTKIEYEYEIDEEDKGDLKLQSITGTVDDAAGNKADLNVVYNGGYYILSKEVNKNSEGDNSDKQNDSTSGGTTNNSGQSGNSTSGDTTNNPEKSNDSTSGYITNNPEKSNDSTSGGIINNSGKSNNPTSDIGGEWNYNEEDDGDLIDQELDYSYWNDDDIEDSYVGNVKGLTNSYAELLPYTGLRIMGYITILLLLACGDIGVYFFIKKKWY